MCVGKHRKGFDSERLSLLFSLASEKEESWLSGWKQKRRGIAPPPSSIADIVIL
jgi:hypothetical protein